MPESPPSLLNIVNGDMAASSLLHAFGASDGLLIHRDVLSCGPLPRLTKVAAWQKARLDFWRNTLSFLRNFDLEPSPIDLLKNAERLRDKDIPCIWAGTGNSDQLLISFVLHLVTMSGGDVSRVQVVQIEQNSKTGQRLRGIGELSQEQVLAHPAPRRLALFELAAYRDAWLAVTASEPALLESFVPRHPDAPRYLSEAVTKVLRRYPERASGLDYWDRRLLENVRSAGPKASAVLAATIAAMNEDADLVGDLYTFSRLVRLSAPMAPQPLVDLSGNRTQISRCEVLLTELGEQVLDGKASFHPANPYDDWAGGVHLSTANGNLWFDDGGKIVRA
jgi:Domain of unknown function (DUF1835)